MPNTENEKKGIVYEAFVKLAVMKSLGIDMLWEKNIEGVIANQDFVYPDLQHPTDVIAVTHWGSHEAANKKYWRTVEDCFEVNVKFPDAKFYSVLFEKNHNSDDALDEQLLYLCNGKAISERNCEAITQLQYYLDTDEKVRTFGAGKEAVLFACQGLYSTDDHFRDLIDEMGTQLSRLSMLTRDDLEWVEDIKGHSRNLLASRDGEISISSFRDTYYKMAIIKLLRFSDAEILEIIEAVTTNNWRTVSDELTCQLVSLKLIKIIGVAHRIAVDPILKSISSIGPQGYKHIRDQISQLVKDPENPFYAYRDHYADITQAQARRERFDFLFRASRNELIQSEYSFGQDQFNRAWILDYYLALKRKLSPRGEYGFQKLSQELGIAYTAGGIVSPLPRYAAGYTPNITTEEKERLYTHIYDDLQKFDRRIISDITVVDDRNITLMKKLDVIGMLIQNAVDSISKAGGTVVAPYRIYSPLRTPELTAAAGATDYNFLISGNWKSALIFVVSAYDASHKHKELSGRLRLARLSDDYPCGEVKNIIVFDGTMFGSAPEGKARMLYEAGWDHIFYVDELDEMVKVVMDFLNL